jgi:hypothetical protein
MVPPFRCDDYQQGACPGKTGSMLLIIVPNYLLLPRLFVEISRYSAVPGLVVCLK